MVLVGAVGEVEARDAHAGAQQARDHLDGARGRAEGADDLGLGPAPPYLLRPRGDALHARHCSAARSGEPPRVVGDRAGASGRSGQERRGEGRRSRGEADGSEGERIYEGWPGLRPVLVEGSLSCSSPRLQLTRGYMALIN